MVANSEHIATEPCIVFDCGCYVRAIYGQLNMEIPQFSTILCKKVKSAP